MIKKYLLLFIIAILFVGLGVLCSQFKFGFLKKPQPITSPILEKDLRKETIEEFKTKEETKRIFKELIGNEPPEFYAERIKGFLIDKPSSLLFIQNIFIFPFPVYPGETLNFLLFLKHPSAKEVKKVVAIIDFKDGNSTSTELLSIKVTQINEEKGTVWQGKVDSFVPPFFATSSAQQQYFEYLLIFKVLDINDQILDEINLPLLMNF